MDFKKRITIIIVTFWVLLLVFQGGALAATFFINSNTNSTKLTQGTGTSSTSGVGFGTATINMSASIGSMNSSDFIRIDNSGNLGWNVLVSATPFTATILDLSSSVGGATVTVAIPSNTVLTVNPQSPTALSGSLTNVTAQNTGGIVVTSSGVKVIHATASYGKGSYKQQLNYTLIMPNYLPTSTTISGAAADSKFVTANRTVGAKIGLFAGTYSSTITYSLITGP
jgi:hypothetical protein